MPKAVKPKIPKSQKIQGKYKLIPENTLLSKEFQNLEPTELKIYMCFLTYWIRNGRNGNTVKMSVDFIAEHTNLSRRTVIKKLTTLRTKEFIDYLGIRNTTTIYMLNTKYTIDYNN
jgi:hypothetical protein